jgi:hypothetical protein
LVEHLADLPHLDCAQQSAESSVEDRPRIPDKDVFDVRLGDAVRSSERHQSDHNWAKDIENAAVKDIEESEDNNDDRIKNVGNDDQNAVNYSGNCTGDKPPKILKTILAELGIDIVPPVIKNISSRCVADPVPGINPSSSRAGLELA